MNPLLRGVLDVRDFNEQQSGNVSLTTTGWKP